MSNERRPADAVVPAERFRMVAGTYGNLANVYVNECFDDVKKTVVAFWFVEGGERFKHFTFVLGAGKTRVTLTDLASGRYHAEATQINGTGDTATAEIDFEIVPLHAGE